MLIPLTSPTACCVAPEGGTSASSAFLAASISSRTQVTGETARSTVLVGSGAYFGDKSSATTRP